MNLPIITLLGFALFVALSAQGTLGLVLPLVIILTVMALWAMQRFFKANHRAQGLSALFAPSIGTAFAEHARTTSAGEVLLPYQTYKTLRHRFSIMALGALGLLILTQIGSRTVPVPALFFTLPAALVILGLAIWALAGLVTTVPAGERWSMLKTLIIADPRSVFAQFAPTSAQGELQVGYTTYKRIVRVTASLVLLVGVLATSGLLLQIRQSQKSADQNVAAAIEQLKALTNTVVTGQGDLKMEFGKLIAQSLQPAPTLDEESLTAKVLAAVTKQLPEAPTEIVHEDGTATSTTTVSEDTRNSVSLKDGATFVFEDKLGRIYATFDSNDNFTLASIGTLNSIGNFQLDGVTVTATAAELNTVSHLDDITSGSEGARLIGTDLDNFTNFSPTRNDVQAALAAIDDAMGSTNGFSFLTIGNASGLSAERALAVGSGLSLTDGGANGSATLAFNLGLTEGAVPFAGSDGNLTTDSSNFFYSSSAHALGLGTSSPTYTLDIEPNGTATSGQTVMIKDATPTTGSTKVVIQASGSQTTANLLELRDASGNIRTRVTGEGIMSVRGSPSALTTYYLGVTGSGDLTTSGTVAAFEAQYTAGPPSTSTATYLGAYIENGTASNAAVTVPTVIDIQAQGSFRAAITTSEYNGLRTGLGFSSGVAGTITNARQLYVRTPSLSTNGAITNLYGVYIDDQNNAGTLNYAIYTNAGLVRLGDGLAIAPSASSAGAPNQALSLTGAAHTALTASTEYTDVNFNLARTLTFSAGALTTQRAIRIQAPTYAFASASTITDAITVDISGAPAVGSNATITAATALRVNTGAATAKGIVVKAASSQSANLQEWQNSSGTVRASISSGGTLTAGTGVPSALNTYYAGFLGGNDASTSGTIAVVEGQLTAAPTSTTTASFAAAYFQTGTSAAASVTIPTLQGVVSVGTVRSATTVTNYYGLQTQPSFTSGVAGTIVNAKQLYVQTPSLSTNGAITNLYGLYMDDQNNAGTLNYAIYTNAGLVRFGGNTSTTGQLSGSDGVVTIVSAGACSDSTTTTDTNGTICIDSSNGRIYYRYGGAWHYSAQTAGFQIPNLVTDGKNETEGLAVGDYVIGRLNQRLDDGALHGLYEKFDPALIVSDTLQGLGIIEEQKLLAKRLTALEGQVLGTQDGQTTLDPEDKAALSGEAKDSHTELSANTATTSGLTANQIKELIFSTDAFFKGAITADGSLTVKADATIYGTLITDSLEVAKAFSVHGDATFLGKAFFAQNVEFAGKVQTKNGDVAGEIKIPAGKTTAKVTFKQAFANKPIVTLTAVGNSAAYSLESVTTDGFTITLQKSLDKDAIFTWFAIEQTGTDKVQVEFSGGEEVQQPEEPAVTQENQESTTTDQPSTPAISDTSNEASSKDSSSSSPDASTKVSAPATPVLPG